MKKDKPKIFTTELIKRKAQILSKKALDIYSVTLADGEYGLPYADETILRHLLKNLLTLDLTTPQRIEKVLQFLPQNPEYLAE